ncbi:hypothetical protein [Brevibacterium aurantiacum]|uniref:hypothetical protein n=1 Tax=Brevibacterium aurantiacum TaxID=273384 RepID=UPI001867108F|nr:hypothetical protein [Brevibacterium aurantiacum]
MTQSPVSNEFGFRANGTAARVPAGVLGPLEAIVVDPSVLGAINPETLNFRNGADSDSRTPWPMTGLAVDLSSRHDIDFFIASAFGKAQLNRLGGVVFDDGHEDEWWTNIHERGNIAAFIAPVEEFLKGAATMMKHREEVWFGVAPLVVSAYDSGIGTTAPGQ